MNGNFVDIFKKRGFYVAVFTVICAAGLMAFAQRSANKEDASQIKLAQEGSREDEASDNISDVKEDVKSQEDDIQVITDNVKAGDDEENLSGETNQQEEIVPNETGKADEKTDEKTDETAQPVYEEDTTQQVMSAGAYSFDQEAGLVWPVEGEIIMKYSSEAPVYFQTVGVFKTNEGILIAANEGDSIKCGCDGVVSNLYTDDEHGDMIEISVGDNYTVTYGQVKDIKVNVGDEVKASQEIASVASPTSYFASEGAHVYMEVREGQESVDPLLLLE